jgi:fido (protein-threonine AMPylation protein)
VSLGIVEGLFAFVTGEQPLTEHFIRGLQAQFTEHQDHTEALTPDGTLILVTIEKGNYKTLPNNPRRQDGTLHAYCPPERTAEEMQRLIEWYRERESSLSPELRAAWLHHRFTQIHPFQDGNGRVARALASLVFLKAGLFPLVVRESDRQDDIGGLESADAGDLGPLVGLFVRRQREAILRALGLEAQVQQQRHAEAIIQSALQVLQRKHDAVAQQVSLVYACADALFNIADERMQEITRILDAGLPERTPMGEQTYRALFHSAEGCEKQALLPQADPRDGTSVPLFRRFRSIPRLAQGLHRHRGTL